MAEAETEKLQLTIQSKLCKATVESATSVAKHLKIEESEVKGKSKISIVRSGWSGYRRL